MDSIKYYDIFLSYVHDNNAIVTRIADLLTEAGLRVWYDLWVMVPGALIAEAVAEGIKSSRLMLVVVGAQPLTKHQLFELDMWQAAHPATPAVILLLPESGQEGSPPINNARIVDFRRVSESVAISELIDTIRAILERADNASYPMSVRPISSEDVETRERELRKNIERYLRLDQAGTNVTSDIRELAVLLRDAGKTEESEAYFKRALVMTRKSKSSDYALSLIEYGGLLRQIGKLTAAESHYREAIGLLEKFDAARPGLGAALNNLGGLLESTSRFTEAERLYRQAVEIAVETFGQSHPNTAAAISNLAGCLARNDEGLDEAQRLYQHVLSILTSPGRQRSTAMGNYSEVLRRKGDLTGARKLASESVNALLGEVGSEHPDYAIALTGLATILGDIGDVTEALHLNRQAAAILEATLGPNHPLVATALSTLASAMLAANDFDHAAIIAHRALEVSMRLYGPRHPAVALRLTTLASIEYKTGELDSALDNLKRALEILVTSYAADNEQVETARINLNVVADALAAKKGE